MTEKSCFALVLRAAHRIALEQGLSSEVLFRDTGLDETVLDDPYTVIGRQQALVFYQNLTAAAAPGIGLDVGLATSLNERGSHGHQGVAVDTIQTAILLGQQFYDIVYMHVGWETRLEGDRFCHRFTENIPLGGARQFCMDRMLAAIQVGAEYYAGPGLKPLLVTLDRPAPAYAQRYHEIFQSPVLFSQEAVEIQYSCEALGYEVSSHDPRVLEVMTSLCENLQQKLENREDIVSKVRRAINLKPGSFPNIEQVAERLACAPRTLRRKLQQRQENFQNILDQERESVASDYLQNSELSIQQISERCGFADAQNFSHAFRRWTGLSPSKFRKANRGS